MYRNGICLRVIAIHYPDKKPSKYINVFGVIRSKLIIETGRVSRKPVSAFNDLSDENCVIDYPGNVLGSRDGSEITLNPFFFF